MSEELDLQDIIRFLGWMSSPGSAAPDSGMQSDGAAKLRGRYTGGTHGVLWHYSDQ